MEKSDLKKFIEFFETNDRLGSLIGVKLDSLTHEACICHYTVKPEHYNPNGILHGGALYSAMDSSQGAFLHFVLDEKFKYAATGTATIRYNAPVTSGKIEIKTWLKEVQNRKHIVMSTATDEKGVIVATLEEIWIATLA